MPRDAPRLEANRVALRPLREDDKIALTAIPRDAEYIRSNGGDPATAGPRSREDVGRWYESRGDSLRWIMVVGNRAEEWPIGEIRFHKFTSEGQSARLAIGIWEPSNRNIGYGTEAVERALEYGFEKLELRFVELYVLENNARARHVYAKCGFREVKLLPDRVYADGRWLADVVMSITVDEWRERRERP